MLVCVFLCALCTRDRGCSAHPAFPAPSVFKGESYPQTSGASRRERQSCVCFALTLNREVRRYGAGPGPSGIIMTPSVTALPVEAPPAFLGVAKSATGKLWRDRLDARGAARALAIVQRHQLPEMLARVLAGRDVELDAVEDFLDPTIRKLLPDPYTVTQMEAGAKRIADAALRNEKVAIFGDYDVDGATSAALLAWHLRHCGL